MAQNLMFEAFPEEILERILLQVIQSPPGLGPKSAILLTCRQWYRIALPLFYDTVHIKNERQLSKLVMALEYPMPVSALEGYIIGRFIRSLVISCPLLSQKLPNLLSQCTELKSLDICLDAQSFGVKSASLVPSCGLGRLCMPLESNASLMTALASLRAITSFTLRKDPSVYITLPRVGHFITGLADCVKFWTELHSIYVAFRLSDDTAVPSPLLWRVEQGTSVSVDAVRSPLTSLTQALSLSPSLESVTTHLPSVWNNVLASLVDEVDSGSLSHQIHGEVKSPNLKRIVLLPGAGSPKPIVTPRSTPPPSRPCSRPPSPDFLGSRAAGGSIPGHGLGLSFLPSSAPRLHSPVLELKPEKTEEAVLPPTIPTNSLYLSTAARHYPKLMELIRAGWKHAFTSSGSSYGGNPVGYGVGRGRAWTWAGE